MEEKNKGKWLKIFAIALVLLAMTFAIVTSAVLNSINKKYDDLNDKNQNLPEVSVQIFARLST